jgi:hypothetical protein
MECDLSAVKRFATRNKRLLRAAAALLLGLLGGFVCAKAGWIKPPHHWDVAEAQRGRVGHPPTLESMDNLAKEYDAAGRVHDAVALYEEILKQRKATLGAEHPETLHTRKCSIS